MRNGRIFIATPNPQDQHALTRRFAHEVVESYADVTKLRSIADANGTSFVDAFKGLIPDAPHIKSGDFGEILIRNILEERKQPAVFPFRRWRYRQTRNDVLKGIDLIGFACDPSEPTSGDLLLLVEVKTRAKRAKATIVRDAYKAVRKNFVSRLAEQLHFHQYGLREQGLNIEADKIARFANPHRHGDYTKELVVAIVHDAMLWDLSYLEELPARHKLKAEVEILILSATQLSNWIKSMRRAAIRHARTLS